MERKSSIINKIIGNYDSGQFAFEPSNESDGLVSCHLLKQLDIKSDYHNILLGRISNDTRTANRCSGVKNTNPSDFDPRIDMKLQVKSFLNLIKSYGSEISSLIELIDHNETLYQKIEYHASDENLNEILNNIDTSTKSICAILESVLSLEPKLLKICNNIHLDGDEISVLIKAYLEGKSWLVVSEEIYVSERQVFNLNKRLIEHLADYIVKQGYTSVFQLFNPKYSSDEPYTC